jgi:hypothetical protein
VSARSFLHTGWISFKVTHGATCKCGHARWRHFGLNQPACTYLGACPCLRYERDGDAPMSIEDDFAEYLRQLCDEPGCEQAATHNQAGKRICNRHLDDDKPAFARDD